MDKDFLLILVGGLVGLVSSLATAVLTHHFDNRRLRAQLERENLLRKAEREREDQLRREEREREDLLRREELRRQSVLRETDSIWKDIERMEQDLAALPASDLATRRNLERRIAEWNKRRHDLLRQERSILNEGERRPE